MTEQRAKRKGIGGHTKPNVGATDDWLTPPWVLKALGPFDLDPCPCLPQPWPTATRLMVDRGLFREWSGRVWLNPPYGPQLGRWLKRLADHGDGIAICFARTETQAFFGSVWGQASAILFLRGRIHFYRPDGTVAKGNAGGPSLLIAYGERNADCLRTCKIPGACVSGGVVLPPQSATLLDTFE